MNHLMTPAEFAAKSVGLPWAKWRADWQGCDCYGLVLLYLKHVLGIELPPVQWNDKGEAFAAHSLEWEACEPEAGALGWMAFIDDAPTHCGILLSPVKMLHCSGSEAQGGSVRVSSLRFVQDFYGELRFFRRATAC